MTGDIGLKALGEVHGVGFSQVKRWVSLYQAHGEMGLTKKYTSYSPQQKLAVLQHMWANELSYVQAATRFNIRSPSVIPAWERFFHSGGISALTSKPRGRPKKIPESMPTEAQVLTNGDTRTREELIVEVNNLRVEIAQLKKLRT